MFLLFKHVSSFGLFPIKSDADPELCDSMAVFTGVKTASVLCVTCMKANRWKNKCTMPFLTHTVPTGRMPLRKFSVIYLTDILGTRFNWPNILVARLIM